MTQNIGWRKSARSIRLVVEPVEHGGWVFLLEPVMLGLLIAPAVAGLWLGLAALAVFLVRQPLKLALAGTLRVRRSGKRYARTALAEKFALGFALLAVAALVIAMQLTSAPLWLPILLAAPFALLQAYFDVRRQSRQLAAELAGTVAIGAAGAAIMLAGGMSLAIALALWALLGLRAVASILYVRTRLHLERGEQVDARPAVLAQMLSLILTGVLVYLGLVPWSALPLLILLAARVLWGLSRFRRPARAALIGAQELVVSILLVTVLALGYSIAPFWL